MEDADQMLQEESVQPGEIIYHPSSREAKKKGEAGRGKKKTKRLACRSFFLESLPFLKQ